VYGIPKLRKAARAHQRAVEPLMNDNNELYLMGAPKVSAYFAETH
jgi:hypothetical protein